MWGDSKTRDIAAIDHAVVIWHKVAEGAVGEAAMKGLEVGVGVGQVEVAHAGAGEVGQGDTSDIAVIGGAVWHKVGEGAVREAAIKALEVGVSVGQVEVPEL